MFSQFASQMGQDRVTALNLHSKHRIWQRFHNGPFDFNEFFFRHRLGGQDLGAVFRDGHRMLKMRG